MTIISWITIPRVRLSLLFFLSESTNRLATPCSFRLPPYPYALILVDRFSVFVGHDWHWFRKQTFRRRLDLTYKDSTARELKDRTWLCRLLIVFALGESYNSESAPEVRLLGDEDDSLVDARERKRVSGIEFFEQALNLLQVRYEDPSVDQVEALNLAVSPESLFFLCVCV